MIKDLRFSDVPRQLLPGRIGSEEDWAYTRAALSTGARPLSQAALLRWSLSASRTQQALVSIDRRRIAGVAVLRARCGRRAWEVAHLYASPDGLPHVRDLLESSVGYVAQRGGERVFLRVLYRSPVQDVARQAGFTPCYVEEVFFLERSMSASADMPGLPMRPMTTADLHGLFRLYNATVPVNARSMVGLTLDQWADAREQPQGSAQEFVWEDQGMVRGWLRLTSRKKELEADALLHPDYGKDAPAMTTMAARLAPDHLRVAWTVPSYQPAVSSSLQQRGWKLHQTYAVLARPAASRVQEPALMPVQA